MGRDTKYKKKFTKQLLGTDKEPGIRYTGLSIVEVCQQWRISKMTYYAWVKEHEDFAEAHEVGKLDVAAYWQRQARAAANGEFKANSGMMIFALKNVDPDNWQDKTVKETILPERLEVVIKTFPTEQRSIEGECEEIIDGD